MFPKIHSGWIQASPTLDLVNDYSRFVIGSFEVISTSAPHIYHSALPLSPQTSIVHKLYQQYTRPLASIVRGSQISWGPIVAATKQHAPITSVAWSPCSRLIAVGHSNPGAIEILDAVTLERLNTFHTPSWLRLSSIQRLGFSLDNRLLTLFDGQEILFSWNIRTGCSAGNIILPLRTGVTPRKCVSSAHSMDGKMVAAAYGGPEYTICTYNLLSETQIYSYRVSGERIVVPVWTHGESLRFVTAKLGSLTIWEAEFNSIHTLAEVNSFPTPDNINCGEHYETEYLFLPTLSRLAFILRDTVSVWDAQASKLLLNFRGDVRSTGFLGSDQSTDMSFSPDGRFFAYLAIGVGIHLWKDSPAGYMLHQIVKPASHTFISPLLSPNGESIIAFSDSTIQL